MNHESRITNGKTDTSAQPRGTRGSQPSVERWLLWRAVATNTAAAAAAAGDVSGCCCGRGRSLQLLERIDLGSINFLELCVMLT